MSEQMITSSGGCHCGAVQFEVQTPDSVVVHECNCSMCQMVGFQHLIVPKSRFKLLQGEADITTYTFNTGVAKHTFCKHCGVKPFYIPRSNPDGFSINLRCLDQSGFQKITLEPFDGQNWEQSAGELAHLSKES
ncbi:GFA family protein [Porticoccaceae bacterium LTM1]|nr:GFA family protein [Porticoccaceae bacterium LTM1]